MLVRVKQFLVGLGALTLVVTGDAPKPSAGGAPAPPPGAVAGYSAPVPEPIRVLRRFDPPSTPYGPGHLGVDLDTTPKATVRAAGAGVVTFAGPVAGRGLVVIQHGDGISTEYEPVHPLVARGAAVARGQPIGTLSGVHRGCASANCLHWGARRAGAYLDPLTLLRGLGPVRLLPWST